VILVHNRADVSTLCLESLARARTRVAWETFVLDNGSRPDEAAAVEATFRRLQEEGRLPGTFRRSPANLGYPAGNNVGFRHLFEQGTCTHVCVLNSDVVVTDWWLDRLLEHGCDAIGPTTNRCGNEQTVPTTALPAIGPAAIAAANAIAEQRHRLFAGHLTATTFLGFFCCVIRREVLEEVGFLDERFGRGGMEDDDFCVRVAAAGFSLVVARDVFVLHWGGASFGELPPWRLHREIARNKRAFERKHRRRWEDRRVLPLRGVFDDLTWLANARDPRVNGQQNGGVEAAELSRSLLDLIDLVRGRPRPTWLESVEAWWHHASKRPILRAVRRVTELPWVALTRKPIVVLGRRHPGESEPPDGYFQRVRLIDHELRERWRIYVNFEEPAAGGALLPGVRRATPRSFEVHCRRRNFVHALALAALTLVSGRIYVHSVLRLAEGPARWLFRLARRRVLDVHGAVPEEYAFHGDAHHASVFDAIERAAVSRATAVVVVSRAMHDHLRSKHGDAMPAAVHCLPMVPRRGPEPPAPVGDRTGVLYCGGLHAWQQLDKMLQLAREQHVERPFTFLVTDPDRVRTRYRELFGEELPAVAASVPAAEVGRWAAKAGFGLALRQDDPLNRVACPTKLVEYLRYGVVPILESRRIGDFDRLGLQHVALGGKLPDPSQRERMARENTHVLRRLEAEFLLGAEDLRRSL
jgi:GT2 family glycosyltransferase